MLLLHCKAKALNGINVKLIDKILLYGSLIIFLKLYFFKKHWIQLHPSQFDRSDSIVFCFCLFFVFLDPLEPALYGWDSLLKYIM